MDPIEFIKEHPYLSTITFLSLLPVALRALFSPAKGSVWDRRLSRFEAVVIDLRKICRSLGIPLPGSPLDDMPAQPEPAPLAPQTAPSLADIPPAVSSTAATPIPDGDIPPALQRPVLPPPLPSNDEPPVPPAAA